MKFGWNQNMNEKEGIMHKLEKQTSSLEIYSRAYGVTEDQKLIIAIDLYNRTTDISVEPHKGSNIVLEAEDIHLIQKTMIERGCYNEDDE